jgi:hypothetical protein
MVCQGASRSIIVLLTAFSAAVSFCALRPPHPQAAPLVPPQPSGAPSSHDTQLEYGSLPRALGSQAAAIATTQGIAQVSRAHTLTR